MFPKQNTYYYQSELQSLNNIMGIVNIVKIPSGIPRTVLIQKEKASRNTPQTDIASCLSKTYIILIHTIKTTLLLFYLGVFQSSHLHL